MATREISLESITQGDACRLGRREDVVIRLYNASYSTRREKRRRFVLVFGRGRREKEGSTSSP